LRYRDRSQVLLLLENLTPYQGSDVGRVLSMRLFSIISSPLDRSCMVRSASSWDPGPRDCGHLLGKGELSEIEQKVGFTALPLHAAGSRTCFLWPLEQGRSRTTPQSLHSAIERLEPIRTWHPTLPNREEQEWLERDAGDIVGAIDPRQILSLGRPLHARSG
jgi:hypothetical protein